MECGTHSSQNTADGSGKKKPGHKTRIGILNELSRNTTPPQLMTQCTQSAVVCPFVPLLIPFNSPSQGGTNYERILLCNRTPHDENI